MGNLLQIYDKDKLLQTTLDILMKINMIDYTIDYIIGKHPFLNVKLD